MSENQKPLADEQIESEQPVSETLETEETVLPAETNSDEAVETTDDSTEEEEEDHGREAVK